MSDIVIATAGLDQARLILERDDADLLVKAIRAESTVPCELIITMRTGQPITRPLSTGTTRVTLSPGRQFIVDDTGTIPVEVPWTHLELRAVH